MDVIEREFLMCGNRQCMALLWKYEGGQLKKVRCPICKNVLKPKKVRINVYE